MPRYTKFLKEILSNKRKFEDLAFVMLNEEYSMIFQNKLLEKQHDPGSFTIPYVIGDLTISDALANLGASINVIPSNLFAKLGLGETKSTRISIQLDDRSIKYPRGVVENVLVKVDKFIFSIDFVILDMDDHDDAMYSINVLDDGVKTQLQEMLVENPLQVTLPMEDEHELSNEKKLRPSIEEPPVLELKELPKHIDYAYRDNGNSLPDISVANLTLEFHMPFEYIPPLVVDDAPHPVPPPPPPAQQDE
ncbi:uncharacterized protein LOC125371190 [Ricinus communis]|uniref:uncharacterized protein LOC125371190 n=1 Tax=Ricinus communis TaxID=3988 RepID=UPI00201AC223|nr:uncharacterized protein LOC125371190 [Ricinus communis]